MAKNFSEKLIEILKTDSRFVDDEGELVKAAVIDRAWKIDRELVKLLLGKPEIKKKFFDEIEGHWIFNINTFIEYMSDKNFLANSYTRFCNKIGLTIDGKFLRERGEVSLVWPYKDCVLEGGQTKEEEKRKEIFFNEILAQDEIDRLFDPKVLTNFKRYTPDGEKKVTELQRDENGTIRENLIIKGNNLLTLHTLKKQFRGKVKLIYIDPPYNRGSDSFGYNDSFNHSAWLTFMKNRLEIAHHLLASDGLLMVQCSFHEHAYINVLMNDLLKRDNYLCTFNTLVRHPDRILTGDKEFNDVIEYTLVYRKCYPQKMPTKSEEKTIDAYICEVKELSKGKKIKLGDKDCLYFEPNEYEIVEGAANSSKLKLISVRGSLREKNSSGRFYVKHLESLQKKYPFGTIFKVPGIGDDIHDHRYFHLPFEGNKNGGYFQGKPVSKQETQTPYSNFLDYHKEYNNVANEGNVPFRNGKKPESYIKFYIDIVTEKGDIVMDFFSGSGTTAAVAHKMGRQFITVEQLDYVEEITVERLKNVIGKRIKKKDKFLDEIEFDSDGISKAVKWQGGGDFIYCELMKYNEIYMDKIQAAKTSKELENIWKEIAENSFLNWYVNPEMPEEAVRDFREIGKTENGLDKQKKLLVELLNKNQLYVNLSEIEDADFKVSEADKKLNREFYGKGR